MGKLLLPSSISAHLKRLEQVRHSFATTAPRETEILSGIFDTALDRLGNVHTGSGWRNVLARAEADYILPPERSDDNPAALEPHFLRIESVRDWLGDHLVRSDLKALAIEELLGFGSDSETFQRRLTQSYARYTGECSVFAKLRIDTVLSGLVALVKSSLSNSERLMIELVRENNLRIKPILAGIRTLSQ
jgi:hypothetical protein